jgi:hypothetical protein
MRHVITVSLFAAAVAVAPAASAAPVFATSYDMLNGETGSYEYWDETYSGAGAVTTNGAPLSGGLGDLTDGIIAADNWFVVEAPAGNGPYVAWDSINPFITFNFAPGTTVDALTIFVDDANGAGGVSTPGFARINGGALIPLADGASGAPLSFTFSGLNATGPLTLELFDSPLATPWIFLSEVQFDGQATVVPEPVSLVLLGVAIGGLALRRRRRARARS